MPCRPPASCSAPRPPPAPAPAPQQAHRKLRLCQAPAVLRRQAWPFAVTDPGRAQVRAAHRDAHAGGAGRLQPLCGHAPGGDDHHAARHGAVIPALCAGALGKQPALLPVLWCISAVGLQAVKPTACTDSSGNRKVLLGDASRTLTCCGSPSLMCYSCKLQRCAFEVIRRSPGIA